MFIRNHWRAVGLAVAVVAAAVLAAVSSGFAEGKPVAATGKSAGDHVVLLARGQYLVTIMGCNDCHTPGAFYGAPDFKRQLAGSELGWRGPWGVSFARNLTPDLDTGLGYWSDTELEKALRTGIKNDGKPMLPPMPWPDFAGLTDPDMKALIAYLRSVPPVKHKVPDAIAPGQAYSGAVLELPPPPAWDAPAPPAQK